MSTIRGTVTLDGVPISNAILYAVYGQAQSPRMPYKLGGYPIVYDGTDLYSLSTNSSSGITIRKYSVLPLTQVASKFYSLNKLSWYGSGAIYGGKFYTHNFNYNDFSYLLGYNLYDWDEAPLQAALSADNYDNLTYMGIRAIEATPNAIFTGTEGMAYGRIRRHNISDLSTTNTTTYGATIQTIKSDDASVYVGGGHWSVTRGIRKYSIDTLSYQAQSQITWTSDIVQILCVHGGFLFLMYGHPARFAILNTSNLSTALHFADTLPYAQALSHYKDNMYIVLWDNRTSPRKWTLTIHKIEDSQWKLVQEVGVININIPLIFYPYENHNVIYAPSSNNISYICFDNIGYSYQSNSSGEYLIELLATDSYHDVGVFYKDEFGNYYSSPVKNNLYVTSSGLTGIDFQLSPYIMPSADNIILDVELIKPHGKGTGKGQTQGGLLLTSPILSGQQVGENIDLNWSYV